jgi:large subunit ribosomal protein L32
MSVRMRITHGKTGSRRAHHKLVAPRLSKCSNCSAMHMRHRACLACGQYRGKMVIDTSVRDAKARIRRTRKEKALGISGSTSGEKEATK